MLQQRSREGGSNISFKGKQKKLYIQHLSQGQAIKKLTIPTEMHTTIDCLRLLSDSIIMHLKHYRHEREIQQNQ